MNHIEQARREWNRADKLKAEGEAKFAEADQHYWKTAEHIAAAVEGGAKPKAIGKQIGRPADAVSHFNATWKKFPGAGSRISRRNFWEHLDLAGHPTLEPEILQRAKDEPERSLKSIRYEINAEDKVARNPAVIRRAIERDPEAADRIVADPVISRALDVAHHRRTQRQLEDSRKSLERKGLKTPASDWLEFQSLYQPMLGAHEELTKAVRALEAGVKLDDEHRTIIDGFIRRGRAAYDFIEDAIKRGRKTMDEALAELLGG